MHGKRGADLLVSDFFHKKKGMSPLIATVLLIAFAVALGAMVMNWSSTLGERVGPDCSAITMIISPYLCYAENMIKMSIRNTGESVEKVTVRVIDENIENEILLKDSMLESGAVLKQDIPFIRTTKTYVGLVPSIEYKDQIVSCAEPVLEVRDLPDC